LWNSLLNNLFNKGFTSGAVDGPVCQDQPDSTGTALDLSASRIPSSQASAPDQVLAAELQERGQSHDALSMMVSSMVRMVQAGKSSDSRWKAS
jgi:hypothetical protein